MKDIIKAIDIRKRDTVTFLYLIELYESKNRIIKQDIMLSHAPSDFVRTREIVIKIGDRYQILGPRISLSKNNERNMAIIR